MIGTLAGSVWQLHSGRELEREKLRSSLILRASESEDPDATLRNLRFLVKSRLINDLGDAIAELKVEDAPSFGPSTARPLAQTNLKRIFGDPTLRPIEGALGPGLTEADAAWVAENLVEVEIPELKSIPGFPNAGRIKFHRYAAPHLKAAFAEISAKGLIDHILSFDGTWVPRFVRGSNTCYSTHTYGIAFDINSRFNPRGKAPTGSGQQGSVVDLVPIFERHGFFWGGRFQRPEAGHFQYGIDQEPGMDLPADVGKASRCDQSGR